MATYYASADHMLRNYWKSIGDHLSYGLKVYLPGGELKAAGTLADEVHEYLYGHTFFSGECRASDDILLPGRKVL